MLHSLDPFGASRYLAGTVELIGQHLRQDLVDQGGLAGTGDTRDAHQDTEGDLHIDVLEVVLPRTDDLQFAVRVDLPAGVGHTQGATTGQVGTGDGVLTLEDALRLTLIDHLATVFTGAGADVDEVVGAPDGVLIMLDHDEGVSDITEVFQGPDQLLVVTLVQADGRLIEDIEHAGQAGTDLGGQADALGLTTGQGAGRAVEGEVGQAHIEQELQARADLLEHRTRDHLLAFAQGQAVEEFEGLGDRQGGQPGNGQLAVGLGIQPHGEDLRLQACALTGRAGHLAGVTEQTVLLGFGVGLLQLAVEIPHDTLEGGSPGADASVTVLVADADLLLGAVDQGLALGGGELVVGGLGVEVQCRGQTLDELLEVLGVGAGVPRLDRLDRGGLRVGHDEIDVHLGAHTQAVAGRAGTIGGVEGERAGFELIDGQGVAVGAAHLLGETTQTVRVVLVQVDELEDHHAVGKPQGGLEGVGEALLLAGLDLEAVDHHVDVVLDLFLQRRGLAELVHLTVDTHTGVPLGREVGEEVDELTLAGAHHRGQELEFQPLLHLQDLIHHVLRGLALHGRATFRAVGGTRAGEQQAQVVIDLGDRAHRGPWVAVGGFLVDGHRGGETIDQVHIGLVHLP
ncbi:conserved hypothetical protein [Corynebacterium efficiens YS-314]|uniref:Uncharacterized protein n=1 Tax=Corynebacterium efficiens (strain DSM 44549 / YS-314 / AJ 12310 / JCM 11189 / NBRC 100395) TaxID=196164 RepID=Q8FTQ5_COREF|nr:conserved hypothetical protein [Corynebacterium efficiens YS-314]